MCTWTRSKGERRRDSSAHDYLEYFYDSSHSHPWNIDETAHRCSLQRRASYLRSLCHRRSRAYRWRSISIARLFPKCPASSSQSAWSSRNAPRQVSLGDFCKDLRGRASRWASIFPSPTRRLPSAWIRSLVSQIFCVSDRAVMRSQYNHVRDLKRREKRVCRVNSHCAHEDNNSRTNWKCVIAGNAENCAQQYKEVIRRPDNEIISSECYGVESIRGARKKSIHPF